MILVDRIESGVHPSLHSVKTNDSTETQLAQAKILKAVEGEHKLKHVSAPADGVSDAIKQAYLEEKKDGNYM